MTVLVLTGSARRDSYTRQLGAAIAAVADGGVLGERLTSLPYYDQDRDAAPPMAVQRLRAAVAAADLVVIVTPEYNGTVPGLLGNAVDWLSRPYGAAALRDKPVLAIAASPGAVGGARALVALRTVLGNVGADLVGPGELVPEVDVRLTDGSLDDLVHGLLARAGSTAAPQPLAPQPLAA